MNKSKVMALGLMGSAFALTAWTSQVVTAEEAPVVSSEASSNEVSSQALPAEPVSSESSTSQASGEAETESVEEKTAESTNSAQSVDALADYKALKANYDVQKEAYDQNPSNFESVERAFQSVQAAFEVAKQEYESKVTVYEEAMTAYQVAKAAYDQALEQYKQDSVRYRQAKAQYDMDQAAYLKAKTQYDQDLSKYREQEAQYQKDLKAYQEAKANYDQAQSKYVTDKAAYDQAKAQFDKDQATYEAGLAEAEAKKNEEGYLSQPMSQSLNFQSEPNAVLTVQDGVKVYDKDEINALVASWNLDGTAMSDWANLMYWKSDLTKIVLEKGKPVTATYSNLQNSSINGKAIKKVVYTYTLKESTKSGNLMPLFLIKDPTETVWYLDFHGETRIGVQVDFYGEDGQKLDMNGALVSFSSLNASNNSAEYVRGFNGRYIPITGSAIVPQADTTAKADRSINFASEGSRWDYGVWDKADGPLSWYGAIVGQAQASDITFDIGAYNSGSIWFAFNSKIAAKGVPTKPVAPVAPTQPIAPTQPTAPVAPVAPQAPTAPVAPTEPLAPNAPLAPEKPEPPIAPQPVSQPVTPPSSELPPKTPEDPQSKLPETGESAFPLTLLGTGSLALAAWLIRKRPKTDC